MIRGREKKKKPARKYTDANLSVDEREERRITQEQYSNYSFGRRFLSSFFGFSILFVVLLLPYPFHSTFFGLSFSFSLSTSSLINE